RETASAGPALLPAPSSAAVRASPRVQETTAAAASPAKLERPSDELRELVYAEPWRTDALRALYAKLEGEDSAELHVVHQLLATFDPEVRLRLDPPFHSAPRRKTVLGTAVSQSSELLQLSALLW